MSKERLAITRGKRSEINRRRHPDRTGVTVNLSGHSLHVQTEPRAWPGPCRSLESVATTGGASAWEPRGRGTPTPTTTTRAVVEAATNRRRSLPCRYVFEGPARGKIARASTTGIGLAREAECPGVHRRRCDLRCGLAQGGLETIRRSDVPGDCGPDHPGLDEPPTLAGTRRPAPYALMTAIPCVTSLGTSPSRWCNRRGARNMAYRRCGAKHGVPPVRPSHDYGGFDSAVSDQWLIPSCAEEDTLFGRRVLTAGGALYSNVPDAIVHHPVDRRATYGSAISRTFYFSVRAHGSPECVRFLQPRLRLVRDFHGICCGHCLSMAMRWVTACTTRRRFLLIAWNVRSC